MGKTLAYLSLLHESIRSDGASMILMCIPFPVQVHPNQCGITYDIWNFKESDKAAKPQSILKEFANKKKIPYIDLLPEFQKK